MTDVWVGCTKHHIASKVGDLVPVCYARDDKIPDRDTVIRHAHLKSANHAKLYGGEWAVFEGVTKDHIVDLRCKLRAEARQGE